MNPKTLNLLLLHFVCICGWSQSAERQVIGSAGLSVQQADITIGEVWTSAYYGNDLHFTGGFQQGELTDVSIRETSAPFDLLLYPNPTRTSFSLRASSYAGISEVHILNAQGQIIRIYQPTSFTGAFDVSDLAAGLYMIEVKTADFSIPHSLVLIKL